MDLKLICDHFCSITAQFQEITMLSKGSQAHCPACFLNLPTLPTADYLDQVCSAIQHWNTPVYLYSIWCNYSLLLPYNLVFSLRNVPLYSMIPVLQNLTSNFAFPSNHIDIHY